ncbi:MAG: AtpZ/AtpI family protein [Limnochordia bacterium]|nr:AtpZ/AtpI family protein [Bacillota bacterium]NLH30728.1 AtpZ/AtpI family protein [Bacillota bacterium]HOB10002.1 AtpZ/AtpI family protein [Limnochordia bacterium]HPZ32001.1 AtpZ/AtpI family protein [Limnochordia bacterium]
MTNEHNGKRQGQHREAFRALAYFSQIGVTMVGTVLVGVLLGKYLDTLFNTKPWLTLVFSFLGAGAAIKALFSISSEKP